jgi:hypothetical protein
MRKFLTIAVSAVALVGFAGSSVAAVGSAVHAAPASMVQKIEWHEHDCSNWDMRHHECRDKGWNHGHDWYGRESCRRRGHDHFIGEDGHWHECPRGRY